MAGLIAAALVLLIASLVIVAQRYVEWERDNRISTAQRRVRQRTKNRTGL